jgi:hypothetical protein
VEAQEKPIVVVGVTESGSSRAALRLAAQEADYRGATLIAIMAYGSNPVLGAPAARPLATSHNADDERLVAESALRDAVADALGDQADRVQQLAVAGPTGAEAGRGRTYRPRRSSRPGRSRPRISAARQRRPVRPA